MILLVKDELQRIWKETIMAGDTIWKFDWMDFSQDDQFMDRGLNPAPAMYETRLLEEPSLGTVLPITLKYAQQDAEPQNKKKCMKQECYSLRQTIMITLLNIYHKKSVH
jgi:hypothetical protein